MLHLHSVLHVLVTANVPSLLILSTLMVEVIHPLKCQFLQEPHGITSLKHGILNRDFDW
jgi:hypothetical protein